MRAHVQPRSFGTHDGAFHSDEVTACALLLHFRQIHPDKIIRTRNLTKLDRCEYVCDVGGRYDPAQKLFDHHQHDYKGSCSSAGLVLSYLRALCVLTEEEYKHLNESLILGVDDDDNGRAPQIKGVCTYSDVIANFVPVDYSCSEEEMDEAFRQALLFALGHIERECKRFHYVLKTRDVVKAEMEKNQHYLLFEEALPWQDSFFALGGDRHPALFVIMRSSGHWNLRGVPPTSDRRLEVRVPLPKEWAGLSNKELSRASGVPGGVFCHKGQFISVWTTKEAAFAAMERTIGTQEKGRK